MRRLLMIASVPLTLAVAGPATAAPLLAPARACPGQNDPSLSVTRQRAVMVCMVRWARRSAHVGPVRVSPKLRRSAQMKANLIARCGTMTHTPCGLAWDRVFSLAGFRGATYENIAAGSGRSGTARSAMAMWMGSRQHRTALLNRRVTVVGVGLRLRVRVDGARMSVWALHLGRPS